jgi:hypothetical protein
MIQSFDAPASSLSRSQTKISGLGTGPRPSYAQTSQTADLEKYIQSSLLTYSIEYKTTYKTTGKIIVLYILIF